ncbi:hypothetical protein N752_00350 [Desulforamulus aquiferis]|nr:hypothetical protein [Desulforamulus aquiferis]RYD07065.1 hypothetical protein N752_00350 [Desulforamulus aquiferis]
MAKIDIKHISERQKMLESYLKLGKDSKSKGSSGAKNESDSRLISAFIIYRKLALLDIA